MNKFLKLAAKIVAGLAIIYLALVIFVAFFIHPDTYKSLLTKAMYKATGRQLVINGKMNLTIFPWPSITANKIIISNPKGFKAPESAHYFATIGALQVRLFALPLLRGHIRPAKLLLSKATINLVTSSSGQNNWSDLLGSGPTVLKLEAKNHSATQKVPPKMASTNYPTLFISGANVHFINEQTKQRSDLLDLGLRTKRIDNSGKRLLEISCMIHRKNPETLIRFNTEAMITVEKRQQTYLFNKLRIIVELMKFKKSRRPATVELNGTLKIVKTNFKASFKGIIRQHRGHLNLNISRRDGFIGIMLNANKVQIEPIISAFTGTTLMQGILDLNTQLVTRGNSVNSWIARLSGKGQLQITAGAIYGLDLKYTVQSALSSILSGKGLKLAPSDSSKTSFTKISASYLIKDSVLNTNDLKLSGNEIEAHGSGTINFAAENINMKLTTLYKPAPKWPVPIIITGNLFSPKIQPDVNAIFKNGINRTLDKLKNINLKKLF